MNLYVDAEWCDTVHWVRLVCEMSLDPDPRAWTFYHYNIHGDINWLEREYCFDPNAYPGYPTACHMIAYGGNFGEVYDEIRCENCTP